MCLIGAVGLISLVLFIWIYRRRRFDKASVKGRRVLVTGASSGIGAEIAALYAKLGASVFITARSEDLLIQVVERCSSAGIETAKHGYCLSDMTKYKTESKKVIEEAVKFLGGLDTLIINHAEIGTMTPWCGTKDNLDYFDNMVDVNFASYIHLASHALPHLMKSKQGRIGITGSVAGKSSWMTLGPYNSCKFALDGFFSAWQLELQQAKDKLTITMVLPGFVGTQKVTGRFQSCFAEMQSEGNVIERMANTQFASSEGTAYESVRATETGQKEAYYPFLYRSAYFPMPTCCVPLLWYFAPSFMSPVVWKPEMFARLKKRAGLTIEE